VGLDALWGLGLGSERLHGLAAELGSDMPFCLEGGTQLCFGRGERLEPVPAQRVAERAVLLLKHPSASVSTPWAYGRCREQCSDRYLHTEADFERRREALRRGALLGALQEGLVWPALRNDLQPVVAAELPVVAEGLAILQRANGALATAMSGSGPSLFAVFDTIAAARAARDQLRAPLAEAGFEAWSCATISDGVRVVSE